MTKIKLDIVKLAKNAIVTEFMNPKGVFDDKYEPTFTIVRTSNITCNAIFWKKGMKPIATRSEMFCNPVDIYAYDVMTGTFDCIDTDRTWEELINETPDIEPQIFQIMREYVMA